MQNIMNIPKTDLTYYEPSAVRLNHYVMRKSLQCPHKYAFKTNYHSKPPFNTTTTTLLDYPEDYRLNSRKPSPETSS